LNAATRRKPTPANASKNRNVTDESEEPDEQDEYLGNLTETKRKGPSAAHVPQKGSDGGENTGETEQPARTDEETFKHELENGLPSTLEAHTYIVQSINQHWRGDARDTGAWQSDLWYFMRLLKAHPDLEHLRWKQMVTKVEGMMVGWRAGRNREHPNRFHESDWLYWVGVDPQTAHAEFSDGWEKIRYLPGHDPLRNALRMLMWRPIQLQKEMRDDRPQGYETFIGLAGWLQVTMGDKPILLPTHRIGEMLSTTAMTISRYRTLAIKDNFLTKVKDGRFGGAPGRGEADQFRFDVSRVKMLDDKARDGTAVLFEAAQIKAERERAKRAANVRLKLGLPAYPPQKGGPQ
jgi:hypothetical protein